MYHPAEVKSVIKKNGKDSETHATVFSWDENLFTFKVSPIIENKIKNGDVVLIDYNPISTPPHNPKWLICKILETKEGKQVMDEYKKQHKENKEKQTMQGPPNSPQFSQIPGIG